MRSRHREGIVRALSAILCGCLCAGQLFAQSPAKPTQPAPASSASAAPASASSAAPAPTPAAMPPGTSAKPLSESLTGPAKSEYEAAKLLYGDGDFAGALLKFQQAYKLSSEPRLLWNVAVCEKNLRHYAKVLGLVEQYQKLGASVMTAQDQKDASDLVAAVKAFVSNMTVKVNEPDAAIFIDDEAVGSSPLPKPVVVDMGSRRLRVTKPGFKDFEDQQPVSGAGDLEVSVTLEKIVHEARLTVAAAQSDTIALDGKTVGTGRWEGKVPSGGHSLRVSAPGMRSYQAELSLADNENRNVGVTLEPEPRSGLPMWVWIAGGAVVAGAAVGGYFLLKPGTAEPPSGSISPNVVPTLFGRRMP
jgi:PEGA domain